MNLRVYYACLLRTISNLLISQKPNLFIHSVVIENVTLTIKYNFTLWSEMSVFKFFFTIIRTFSRISSDNCAFYDKQKNNTPDHHDVKPA